jgi:hypothetical protein
MDRSKFDLVSMSGRMWRLSDSHVVAELLAGDSSHDGAQTLELSVPWIGESYPFPLTFRNPWKDQE